MLDYQKRKQKALFKKRRKGKKKKCWRRQLLFHRSIDIEMNPIFNSS